MELAPLFHICCANARSRSWFTRWTASMSGPQHMVSNLSGWQRDSRLRTSVRTSVGATSQSIGWIAIRMTASNSQSWQNKPDERQSSRNPIYCGTRERCSAPAAHVSPQQFEVVVADLAAPRRHGGRLAIEHRIAEAREIVLGKLAQVEGDAAGIDHVAAVAGHAEAIIHFAPEIGVVCSRGGGQHHVNCQRRQDPRSPWMLRARRASHAQTFFCRTAAT